MKKYKVYLSDLHGSIVKTGDLEHLGYCVKSNIIFNDLKTLEEMQNINKEIWHYLVGKDELDDEIKRLNDEIEYWKSRYENLLKISGVE